MKKIGVIFPHQEGVSHSAYYSTILLGVSDGLLHSKHKLRVLLLTPDRRWDGYDFKSQEDVDGLVLAQWSHYFFQETFYQKLDIPCVIINDVDARIRVPFVSADQVGGGRLAAEHLYRHGHRRVGIVTGPAWSQDSHQRTKGFLDFFQDAGVAISSKHIVAGDYHEQMAYDIVGPLFGRRDSPTALFCCNDLMAFGAIMRLKELGIRCPEDVSVIGFDDHPLSAAYDPLLTTVRVPLHDLAQEATRLLIARLNQNDPSQPFVGEFIRPVELIERKSVKGLR